MSEVIVTVRGEHEARVAPEEAVARVSLRVESPDRGTAVERIAALASPLREDLEKRKADGGLTEWSSQRVSVWADRPWNNEGKQLPQVHHASVEFTATFTDFAALSWWLSDIAERDGVQVDGVQWKLTPATERATEAEVATQAVQVAVARATAYASALGLASVTALEVADTGLLARPTPEAGPPMLRSAKMFAASADMGGGPAVELQPQDIVVTAGVEARFLAR